MLLSVSALAQNKGIKLTGYVFDIETNTPLPGVNVIIGGTSSGTSTNSEGLFSYKVDKVPVLLYFSYMGYESNQFLVKSSEANPIKVYLKPQIREIGEVTISGERIMNLFKGDTLNILDYEIRIKSSEFRISRFKDLEGRTLH